MLDTKKGLMYLPICGVPVFKDTLAMKSQDHRPDPAPFSERTPSPNTPDPSLFVLPNV